MDLPVVAVFVDNDEVDTVAPVVVDTRLPDEATNI